MLQNEGKMLSTRQISSFVPASQGAPHDSIVGFLFPHQIMVLAVNLLQARKH
jgi:hypothetical protein